jgi:hypothetical protein
MVYKEDKKLLEVHLWIRYDHVHKSFPGCAQMIFT